MLVEKVIGNINDDKFTLNWYSYGGVECVAHIIFDDNYNPEDPDPEVFGNREGYHVLSVPHGLPEDT